MIETETAEDLRAVSTGRVMLLGVALVLFSALGFFVLPGMISEDAGGSHAVNAIYCAVMTLTTVGFGDICPSERIEFPGRFFIIVISFCGMGMFCGPVMNLASSWRDMIPGGIASLASFTLFLGVVIFTYLEGMSQSEAVYFSVITGTTIGYGDISPRSDIGKLAVAAYAILVINVVGALLEPAKDFLESFCKQPPTQQKEVPEKKEL
mmetsp:Transcript_12038/g.20418  ORF Transcript_12038/g.20418 Transcript_12038/m.20418 type:complete len:208 (-) Transcript_12038:261-884(-)